MYVDKCTQKSMVDIRPQCAAGRKKTSNQLNIRKLPRPQLRYYRYKIRMDDDTRRNSGIIPDALTLAYEHFLLGCIAQ